MKFTERQLNAGDIVGGHVVLNFVNTVTAWDGVPRDYLQGFEDACDWAILAGLGSGKSVSQVRRISRAAPRKGIEELARLREFRGAVHETLLALARKSPIPRRDLQTLEAHWKGAVASSLLHGADHAVPVWTAHTSGVALLRHSLAWQTVSLLDSLSALRLKVCAAPDCGWMFLDTSKSGRRRWCDMGTCGNKAKATRFQLRSRSRKELARG